LLQYAELKIAIKNRRSHREIIPQAEALDCQLDLLSQQLRPFIMGKKDTFSRRTTCDKYPDHSTRRSWNNIRVIRILLAKTIREQCAVYLAFADAADSAPIVEKLDDATQIIISLATEICFSIPHDKSRDSMNGDFSSVQNSIMFFRLFVSESSSAHPADLQTTICKRLGELISKRFCGLERIMTEILRESTVNGSDIWKVWLKIGHKNF
jgi:hypothetical protein